MAGTKYPRSCANAFRLVVGSTRPRTGPGAGEGMRIEETFTVEIPEIEEDYPDQAAEYRMQVLTRDLIGFIRHVVDEHTETTAESDVVIFDIAVTLINGFVAERHANLLRVRLGIRFPQKM